MWGILSFADATEGHLGIIYQATNQGGLFVTSINLYPTKLAEAAHMMLPSVHPGEMNLTSMNGERRLRLSQKFMDAPGEALPDCLIAAKIANSIKAMYQSEGNADMVKRFSGFECITFCLRKKVFVKAYGGSHASNHTS